MKVGQFWVEINTVYDRHGFGGEANADFYALHGMRDETFLLIRPHKV